MIGELASPEISGALKDTSILCLPLGAIEQHGAHLPLDTDVTVAEGLTRRIVARWGDEFDLWQLPTFALGLSREHDWAPGTLSLSIQGFAALLRDLAGTMVRALPARNLAIVNGHGGRSETSVMLALAPDLVRRDLIGAAGEGTDAAAIRALIFDRGVSFPWRTDDPRLALGGIIGNARAASADLGQAIIDSIVAEAGGVLARLLENQKLVPQR